MESRELVIEATGGYEAAVVEIEQAITQLCQPHEPFKNSRKRLLALPGVGPKVVLPLMIKL